MTSPFDKINQYVASSESPLVHAELQPAAVLNEALVEIETKLEVASSREQADQVRQQLDVTKRFLLLLSSQEKFQSPELVQARIELAEGKLLTLEAGLVELQTVTTVPESHPLRDLIGWAVTAVLGMAFVIGPGTQLFRYWFVSGVDLRGRSISCDDLRKLPDLYRVKLDQAVITGDNCDLSGRELSGSSWRGTVIPRGLNLSRTNLQDSVFVSVKGEGLDLSLARLNGSSIRVSDLRRSNLRGIVGNCSIWQNVDLTGSDLSFSTFSIQAACSKNGTAMVGVTLSGSNLSAADLSGLSVTDVKLEGVIKTGATMPGG